METLEKLMAEGRITDYQVFREKDRFEVSASWVDYSNFPGGELDGGFGKGETLDAAITDALMRLPVKVAA